MSKKFKTNFSLCTTSCALGQRASKIQQTTNRYRGSLNPRHSGNGQILGMSRFVHPCSLPSYHLTQLASGIHRDTHRCEYLVPEFQCLRLKEYIQDLYGISLPPMPSSFNTELLSGRWDITIKYVSSEPEFNVYARLAKTATRNLKSQQKLDRAIHARNHQLEQARRKFASGHAKFVCVDIECYELDHQCTTEVGLSMLIVCPLTGVGGITSRHLLIREYAHLRNSKFVPDMSGSFGFGASEWVHLRDCRRIIRETFRSQGLMPVYMIGHDPMADIRYLEKNLRCPRPPTMNVFDTRLMFSAFGGDPTLRNLAACLDALGIQYWNLHNAGTACLKFYQCNRRE